MKFKKRKKIIYNIGTRRETIPIYKSIHKSKSMTSVS